MRLDLHIHSRASDGAWSGAEVVAGAARGGLDVIALADHDTTAGVAEARAAAAGARLQVIPAIELSTTHGERDVHVLGYFVDADAPCLLEHADRALRLRTERMREMLRRLAVQGVEVSLEEVEAAAGPSGRVISRPHLARALVKRGLAASVPDAFARYIADGLPAFVPTRLATPAEGVALILEAGGIPVWAHPPEDLLDELLPGLVSAGLRGLEVYRPVRRRAPVLRLEEECRSRGFLVTGGSDWHTPDAGTLLGDFFVTGREVEAFLRAGGM